MTMQEESSSWVTAMIDAKAIRRKYPDTISSEQLRKLLHISKRRCVWLLKHYIPHRDNGGKTRRYAIKLEDAIRFMTDFEQSPERYTTPDGQFSSKPYILPAVNPGYLRLTLEDEWFDVPDLLDTETICSLTGYSDNAVNNWLEKGKLRSALTQNGRVTSKAWLIDFFCGKGMRIVKKSEKHIHMLNKAL